MNTRIKKEEIPEEDVALFEAMKGNYISKNEERFFRIMQYKEEYELAPQNDLLLDDKDNEDGISILRVYNAEYDVIRVFSDETGRHRSPSSYSDCLADALSANLKECGILDYDCTLLEWLRKNNYNGVRYDGNCNEDYAMDYSNFE